MNLRFIGFLTLLAILFSIHLVATGNPFLKKTNQKKESVPNEQTEIQTKPAIQAGAFSWILSKTTPLQRKLHTKLTSFARKVKESPTPLLYLISFFFAFIYGIIHAVGPGHGKAFASTYFISRKAEFKDTAILGILIAVFHTLSAVILVSALHLMLSSSRLQAVDSVSDITSKISFSLIILIGTILLIVNIINIRKKNHEETSLSMNKKNIFIVALIAGIIPCPGTTLLLLFSLSLGIFFYGIFLAVAMAGGTALTISAAGTLSLLFKKSTLLASRKNSRIADILPKIFLIGGPVLIIIIGVLLLTA